MENIILEKKYALEYIKDILNDVVTNSKEVTHARYHHNSSYYDAPSIIKNGILSIKDLNILGLKKYSDKNLKILCDINSHVNSDNSVSLSVLGLSDIYENEDEYDPYYEDFVDFLISSDIKARRATSHYGNEYLSDSISPDKLRSVDLRILKLIKNIELRKASSSYNDNLEELIRKYNALKCIALSLKQSKLSIPLREMSENKNLEIDVNRASKLPKLILK